MTGDLSYATGGVAALINDCGNLAAVNISMYENDTNGNKPPAESALVQEITERLCPNDCTFKGKCVNGSCVCIKDFTAEDCSVSIYQIPAIFR